MKPDLISLIIPFYNEGRAVDLFFQAIDEVLAALDQYEFELVCVDDGSRDDTLHRLIAHAHTDSRITVVELTRNFGKEAAMTAGIHHARGIAAIVLDADLQDPPELIGQMLATWKSESADMVLARRADRTCDGALKRLTAKWFYRLHNRVANVQIPENVGDFRLMTRPVLDALKALPERQRFMKGLFAWVGFKTVTIDYVRQGRAAGTTKFSGWKLWNFALDGVSAFSTMPLRVWTYLGGVVSLLTALYALYYVTRVLTQGIDVPGYASLLIAVLFFGGVQLVSVGILGEYMGRIHEEVKQRPIYLVRAIHHQHALYAHETPTTARHSASHLDVHPGNHHE
ncbi:glycosyltransferase family 2 protein [Bordetella sp. 02P26C-1]|uniref:glycosyltransferase family 2 protein n=1 Tax=Bordetella sp. 02P26C-1 TaxID=2683195 RepID=UPI00135539D6|nr:glycosyltransferase family 2 protein [Bordetella sp. 02P26C-1]MVW79190.1 glycosyltransferase [Bordetella sp. 02P26C-1]